MLSILVISACDLKRNNPLDPQSHLDISEPGTVSGLNCSSQGMGNEPRAVILTWNNNEPYDTDGYYVYRSLGYYNSYALIDTVYHAPNVQYQSYTHSSVNDPSVRTGDYWYRVSAFKRYPAGALEGRPCDPKHARVN